MHGMSNLVETKRPPYWILGGPGTDAKREVAADKHHTSKDLAVEILSEDLLRREKETHTQTHTSPILQLIFIIQVLEIEWK